MAYSKFKSESKKLTKTSNPWLMVEGMAKKDIKQAAKKVRRRKDKRETL